MLIHTTNKIIPLLWSSGCINNSVSIIIPLLWSSDFIDITNARITSLLWSSDFIDITNARITSLLWSSCFVHIANARIMSLLWSSCCIYIASAIIITLLWSLHYNQNLFSELHGNQIGISTTCHTRSLSIFFTCLMKQFYNQPTHQKNLKSTTPTLKSPLQLPQPSSHLPAVFQNTYLAIYALTLPQA
jgi:hypothetical protein